MCLHGTDVKDKSGSTELLNLSLINDGLLDIVSITDDDLNKSPKARFTSISVLCSTLRLSSCVSIVLLV